MDDNGIGEIMVNGKKDFLVNLMMFDEYNEYENIIKFEVRMLECKNLVKFCRKHYIPPSPPSLTTRVRVRILQILFLDF